MGRSIAIKPTRIGPENAEKGVRPRKSRKATCRLPNDRNKAED